MMVEMFGCKRSANYTVSLIRANYNCDSLYFFLVLTVTQLFFRVVYVYKRCIRGRACNSPRNLNDLSTGHVCEKFE